jgi:diguanylate cyclase (GGDEF)-like protein/PAS domain S-box-containing protein
MNEMKLDVQLIRYAFQHISDAAALIAVEDHTFRYAYLNPAALEIAGFYDEVCGKRFEDIYVDGKELEERKQQYKDAAAGGKEVTLENVCPLSSGSFIGRCTITPIPADAPCTHLLVVAKDMAEARKQAERIKMIENLVNSLLHSTTDAVVIGDQDGTIIEINEQFKEIFGWEERELKGIKMIDSLFIPKDKKDEIVSVFSELMKGKHIPGVKTQRVAKSGTLIDVSINFNPLFNKFGGLVGYTSLIRDTRDESKIHKALKESEERYRLLVETSPEPIIVHHQGTLVFLNKATAELVGIKDEQELIGKNLFQFVHLSDWKTVQERTQYILTHWRTDTPCELRVIRSDGSMITVEMTGAQVPFGEQTAVQVICRNISERKRIELALKRSEQNYKLIADNMTDLVGVVDPSGIVEYASPSHEAILGLKPGDIEGRSVMQLFHPEDVPQVVELFSTMVSKQQKTNIQFRYLHAEGYPIIAEATGTPILTEDGDIEHILIVAKDIREREQYEKRLREMAYYDSLTGLPNRIFLEKCFQQELNRAKRNQSMFAVLFLDMDELKQINDTLGHGVGDDIIIEFSKKIKGCLRETDTMARLGGDEFIILLPDIHSREEIRAIADRMITCLSEPITANGQVMKISTSIGVSIYPKDGEDRMTLMKLADDALYCAKRSGKNGMHFTS